MASTTNLRENLIRPVFVSIDLTKHPANTRAARIRSQAFPVFPVFLLLPRRRNRTVGPVGLPMAPVIPAGARPGGVDGMGAGYAASAIHQRRRRCSDERAG